MTQYAIRECAEDEAKNGRYLRLILGNKAGTVKAVRWQRTDEDAALCKVGAVIEVDGQLGEYRGERQLNISAIRRVAPDEIRYVELLPVSPFDRESQRLRLREMIHRVKDDNLRSFLCATLCDEEANVERRYGTWPGAVMYHHAWIGGLLDHSMEVCYLALELAKRWPTITNPDIIITGALLHDIGKMDEIGVDASFEFTDSGRMLGHIALGLRWLEEQRCLSGLGSDAVAEIAHIIASHHGEQEHGAITTPKTANALAIHLADLASAKMTMANQAITAHTGDEPWTVWDRAAKTQYFVG